MHSYILQDWITIRGAAGVTTVTQSESGWLDLSPYQDLTFWIDTRESRDRRRRPSRSRPRPPRTRSCS